MASPFNLYVPDGLSPLPDFQAPTSPVPGYDTYQPQQLKPALEAAFDGDVLPTAQRKRMTQYVDQDDPGQVIGALVDEVAANVRSAPQPSPVANFFGPLMGKRGKMPERALDDERRKYFYEALLDRYGRPEKRAIASPYGTQYTYGDDPEQWGGLPPQIVDNLRKYATDPVYRESIQTPYENTGFLGPGSALSNAGTWLMAMPQALYATAEGAANAITPNYRTPTDQVWDKFDKASETLYAPVTAAVGAPVGDKPSYWEDREQYRRDVDSQMAIAPSRDYRWTGDDSLARGVADIGESLIAGDSGQELLDRYDADELIGKPGTAITGAVMDAMLNPLPPDIASITASARSGKSLDAFRQLLVEFGPDAAALGAQFSLEGDSP